MIPRSVGRLFRRPTGKTKLKQKTKPANNPKRRKSSNKNKIIEKNKLHFND